MTEEKKVTIAIREDTPLPTVAADEKKLHEVLTNLLSNAVKYNREQGEVVVSYAQYEDRVYVEIHDTGYGIPEEEQQHIFEKFFRATTGSEYGIMGTGLGLFITRMLVERMGGQLTFSSVEGAGTTFALSLVVVDDALSTTTQSHD